jgi:hypothetical protein
MAKERPGKAAGDGCPAESVELSGKIITAAKSTMDARSFERGYPDVEGRLHMRQGGAVGKPK